ncbi:Protein kinase-like domain protein [Niveomyces insectorum RCEF 264]|uniref:Protein kinase-like domain protein n=1 Tax=Niveomyces insectorum RCEF 264 TaxID=1081102 RepID=A0A167LTP1_9HYPO|nr:Protein kinase-like domain protein [Niveomyces insectorum RCEF 264]
MASTITGNSGRVYEQGAVLQKHLQDPNRSVFKAKSGDEFFAFKRVPRPFYDESQRLAADLAGSRRLRLHVDANETENILIYRYFRGTLLGLLRDDPDLPFGERRKILRYVGEAIQELHHKSWIHIDVKPDNVFLDWTTPDNASHQKTVTDAVLGDFDIAFRSENGQPRHTPYAIGNAMWRSLEGQTGTATRASDVFSFGLVCIYALGGGDLLLLENYQELVQRGIPPEQEIVTRHFAYFGRVCEGLLQQVQSEIWKRALRGASAAAEKQVEHRPELRFAYWGQELGPAAQEMIAAMTNPDPTARPTIDNVLESPFWQDDDV